MATFAVLQPTKLEDHQRSFHHGHDHGGPSENLIDLDEPSPATPSMAYRGVDNLIDFDDEPSPPKPVAPKHVTSLPAVPVAHRRMFSDREEANHTDNSSAMEGIEHHSGSQVGKLNDEDLIDMHTDRKNAILQEEPVSILDMDEPQRKFGELTLSQGAPRAPKAMEQNVSTSANATPIAPRLVDRSFLVPKGPSRHLRHSDPWARDIYLGAQQEYFEAERRARIRFYCRTYNDVDDMGDYRRRGYRGGGGGGGDRYSGGDRYGGRDRRSGGGGGLKRRYDDEDDYDRPQYYDRRLPPVVQVRNSIIAVADDPERDPVEDVATLAKMIEQHHEEPNFMDSIKQLIPQLATEQPLKIPHVAATVLYLNQKKPDLAEQILESVGIKAQAALDSGDWRSLKLLLKFLACTHGLFEGDGVFTVLEELFDRAVDLQAASTEDALGIELVKIIMLTLPYIIASGALNVRAKVEALLEKTGLVASAELDAEKTVNPYVATVSEEATQLPKLITVLQTQLQNEAARDWPLKFLPKLYKAAQIDETGQDTAQKHSFPALVVPAVVTAGPRLVTLELYQSLYVHRGTETVPPASDIATCLIRDALVDTINILDFNREAATRLLIDLDQYFTPGFFAKRNTPYPKIEIEAAEGRPTWKTEDLAVDAIFSQLLQLPAPEHKLVYFHSIITHACKISPAAFAPVLGRAIRFVYRSVESLDLELVARYTDWFAHHLSNYDFRWKWDEWVDDVFLPNIHPKQAFIRGALGKEIRLSFAKRIRDGVPNEYHRLIPETMDNDIPTFKYNESTTPFATEALAILTAMRKKVPDSDLSTHLDAITTQAASQTTISNPSLPAIDAYVTTLCYIGSKSLSHVLTFVERCQTRLLSFSRDAPSPAEADAARIQIVDSVVSYWRDTQTGVAVNVVDKLLNYGIITPRSVIAWALGSSSVVDSASSSTTSPSHHSDPKQTLPESWVFEMLSSTLSKVSNRVRQLIAARAQPSLPPSQATTLEQALEQESGEMDALFGVVEDALKSVAIGSDDVMLEAGVGDGEGDGGAHEDAQMEMGTMKLWGRKWVRVFERKRAVERKFGEEARKAFPEPGVEPEPEPEPEVVPAAKAVTDGEGKEGKPQGEVEMKDGVGGGDDAVLVNGNGATNGVAAAAGDGQGGSLLD